MKRFLLIFTAIAFLLSSCISSSSRYSSYKPMKKSRIPKSVGGSGANH